MQHPPAHPSRPNDRTSETSGWRSRLVVLVTVAALLATGCGDEDSGDDAVGTEVRIDEIGESLETGYPDGAEPQRGGQLVYGLEAESDNFCLPSAQLAIAGQQVLRAIYDPLVLPDAEGQYRPYLADSIEPSDDYKTWIIKIRPNVTFHNEEKLTADVVKNNLDAYRGKYPNRAALLFGFALDNIETVSVVNELTVRVTTTVPWVAFPAALYQSGRFGIIAQAQLDADEATCETKPIGTGPFEFVSWEKGSSLKVARNANYWQIAEDGKPYPYVNAIDFRPMSNADERTAALVQGDINMMHTAVIADLVENIPALRDEGLVNMMVSDDFTETSYAMLNAGKAPFDNREARLAFTHALNREELNRVANKGGAQLADGPFAPGVMGYVANPERPAYDVAKATELVAGLKARGVDMRIEFVTTIDPAVIRWTSMAQDMLEEVGFEVILQVEEQEQLVDRAIAGEYHVSSFRLQPGDDPDQNHVWWYGDGNPVNFARFDDPEINDALDKGRSEDDEATRRGHYETVAREMAAEQYYSHLWYVPWAVVEARNVHGIVGPVMPSGHAPSTRLANGHALHGMWIDG